MEPKSIDRIFWDAAQIASAGERDAYLDRACAEDVELRQRIEQLLQAKAKAESFLESPAPQLIATFDKRAVCEGPGTMIGPYKLLEQIGEGGFGVVYMAEQQQPVRRKIALKVLKPGMDTRQVVARFEAERQALALMDHPNIARVFDGGQTASGRPYFVMELVRGIPITDFCDQNQIPVRERLELFVVICQAVQHAHQKGIIHRDLKPSNVLVTLLDGTPLVKVIDFGIAKALGQEHLTDKTLFTGFAHMIGTPLYMSPEQAEMSGQDADTRTDIYALGVLLYELLTGTTPFDKERLKEASYDEIRRIIREEEPAKPSTRISTLGQAATTVSANRKSEPGRLSQLFRRELDWIVMKALEKERSRRYETASAFAADVHRYLHDEPVQACPPSAWYRLRKFSLRNKMALVTATAAAVVVLLAVAGLATSNILIRQEKSQTDAARHDLERTLYYHRIALAERESSTNSLGRVDELLDACPAALRSFEWHYLKRLRQEGIRPFHHPAAVHSAVFSGDGRWIASGSQDGIVTVWDAATGEEWLKFQTNDPEGQARCVAFSPDSRRLASSSWDKTVKVWEFDPLGARRRNRKDLPLLRLMKCPTPVGRVVFSPDGTLLAAIHEAGVHVWDAGTGERAFFLPGRGCVAFRPDGQSIAAGKDDAKVAIWDAQTGRERQTLPGHAVPVRSVAFSPDGQWLASAASDQGTEENGEVKVWDLQTGREAWTLRGHVSWIFDVAFSSDGRRLASAGRDGNVKLWDLTTGQEVLNLRGHHGGVRSVAFSREGNRLVSAGADGTVRVWDATPLEAEAGQELTTLRGHQKGVRSLAFSPDGRHLASAGDDATLRIWEFEPGRAAAAIAPTKTLASDNGLHHNVAFSSDGRLLAYGGGGVRSGGRLNICNTRTWKPLSLREFHRNPNTGSPLAFSRDGQFLAAGSADFVIEVRNAASGREIHRLEGHGWVLNDLTFGPKPEVPLLASASSDRTVRIWNVKTGEQIESLRHTHNALCVAFSRDGQFLASGGEDRVVKLWDAGTWKLIDEWPDPNGAVNSVMFHPQDSHLLAWGSTDGTVKVWNRTTREIRTLRGHISWVEGVAFSPDGEWLASASLDGTIKLWRVPPLLKAPDQAQGILND